MAEHLTEALDQGELLCRGVKIRDARIGEQAVQKLQQSRAVGAFGYKQWQGFQRAGWLIKDDEVLFAPDATFLLVGLVGQQVGEILGNFLYQLQLAERQRHIMARQEGQAFRHQVGIARLRLGLWQAARGVSLAGGRFAGKLEKNVCCSPEEAW